MPLYLVEDANTQHLIYAKTARGATNEYLAGLRSQLVVSKPTPIEAAVLAKQGVRVRTVGKGEDVVMENDPPEVKRGFQYDTPETAGAKANLAASVMGAAMAALGGLDATMGREGVEAELYDDSGVSRVEVGADDRPEDHEEGMPWDIAADANVPLDELVAETERLGLYENTPLDSATPRCDIGEEEDDNVATDPA